MIDPVSSGLAPSALIRPQSALEAAPIAPGRIDGLEAAPGRVERSGSGAFSDLVGGLVRAVDEKSKVADGEVRKLMVGESDNIHRSMIAMQESGLSFSLLVEVRNKLVESYQELMRMPV